MSSCAASIVITAYNAEAYIGASIAAALGQDHLDFEVVIVDDGSTDRTAEICGSISDARLRYFRRARIGRSRALNEAIRLARGKFIAINDADDLSLVSRLSYTTSYLNEHPDCVLVGTAYQTTTEILTTPPTPDAVTTETAKPKDVNRRALYRGNPFVHSTVVFCKTAWERTGGYDEQLGLCVDYDFFLRAMQFGSIAWLPQPTIYYYKNTTSFFKKKSHNDYLNTLRVIKARARKLLQLPSWVRAYELISYYEVARSIVMAARR